MARLNISESQFAFAFFHKFMGLPENKGKSFVVPSLLQEGGKGVDEDEGLKGVDLKIEDEYFFQFKMTDAFSTKGIKEFKSIARNKRHPLHKEMPPFVRLYIKNSENSCQFNALVKLAGVKGAERVFYVFPNFDLSLAPDRSFERFLSDSPNQLWNHVGLFDFHFRMVDDNHSEMKPL